MRRRQVLVGAAAGAAGLALPGGLRRARAQDMELLNPGELSAATEGTWPPFSMRDADGNLDGIEIQVMAELCKRMGLAHKPVIQKWEGMLVGLLAEEYDMCSDTMAITDERKQKVWFCDAWIESGARLVVQQDSSIQSAADASGKRVGTLVASIFVPIVEKMGATVVDYKADVEALQDLVLGKIDGVVTEAVTAGYMIQQGQLPLRVTPEIMEPYQDGWPVVKGKTNLVKGINAALASMNADGTFEAICKSFIGINLAPANPIRTDFS